MLDLVSQVRNVVLMNVYLDLGNPGGSGFWNKGVYEPREGNGKLVYNTGWMDPVTARRVPSKKRGVGKGSKGEQRGISKGR